MPDTRVTLEKDADGNTVLGGYLAVWGAPDAADLLKQYFTPETDFDLPDELNFQISAPGYHAPSVIGYITGLQADIVGLRVTEMRWHIEESWLPAVVALVGQGVLYWAAVSKHDDDNPIVTALDGRSIRWPLQATHLTPAPSQPPDRDWTPGAAEGRKIHEWNPQYISLDPPDSKLDPHTGIIGGYLVKWGKDDEHKDRFVPSGFESASATWPGQAEDLELTPAELADLDAALGDALRPDGSVDTKRLIETGRTVSIDDLRRELHLPPRILSSHDRARAALEAAGRLVKPEDLGIPPGVEGVSDEELEELGTLPEGARGSEALVDEDRGGFDGFQRWPLREEADQPGGMSDADIDRRYGISGDELAERRFDFTSDFFETLKRNDAEFRSYLTGDFLPDADTEELKPEDGEQGNVMGEYALLLVTAAALVRVILSLVTGGKTSDERQQEAAAVRFQYLDRVVQECVASERYTRDECLTLAGER